jgi:3-deoxy-D-manno-octulosonic-acid transferase
VIGLHDITYVPATGLAFCEAPMAQVDGQADAWIAASLSAFLQRFDEVAALLSQRGLRYVRRGSADALPADTQVLLGDSMGEMAAYYAAADVAFIGGSLVPTGGQNFIEACTAGTPVLFGPQTFNFAESAALAVEAGAAVRVHSPDELAREAERLLQDDAARAEMSRRALAFTRAHQGATERSMQVIARLLPADHTTGDD